MKHEDIKLNPQQVNRCDLSDLKIPDGNRIHIANWNQKPRPRPMVTLHGVPVAVRGALTFLSAMAGCGKSRILEILCTLYLNPNIDGLGFELNLTDEHPKFLC